MISVVICSAMESRGTRAEAHYRALLKDDPHEIIVIKDAKSLAEAYNRAVSLARGDIFIFSHDDIEFLDPDVWLEKFKSRLAEYDLVGLAGTTRLIGPAWAQAGPPYTFGQVGELDGGTAPYRALICGVGLPTVPNIQAADGLFLAVKRNVVEQVGFDERIFDGFHCYDVDFTFSAYLAGYRLAIATDLPVLHESQGNFDQTWHTYAKRFMEKHGDRLHRMHPRRFQHTLVSAQTKAELLEILQP